ncbi:hypothetical protein O6H91_06G113700 [Diphasiastrum complanatum]|uniref:Uncharacterized protein n=1 Tax=Diphasiastrum complanatum TaxID=34168 RepID=A0ACC2DHR3_DIPCM|nr:hypothetical protein O6H91_06G113700 [Diphasiastrum complanatum]
MLLKCCNMYWNVVCFKMIRAFFHDHKACKSCSCQDDIQKGLPCWFLLSYQYANKVTFASCWGNKDPMKVLSLESSLLSKGKKPFHCTVALIVLDRLYFVCYI